MRSADGVIGWREDMRAILLTRLASRRDVTGVAA